MCTRMRGVQRLLKGFNGRRWYIIKAAVVLFSIEKNLRAENFPMENVVATYK